MGQLSVVGFLLLNVKQTFLYLFPCSTINIVLNSYISLNVRPTSESKYFYCFGFDYYINIVGRNSALSSEWYNFVITIR